MGVKDRSKFDAWDMKDSVEELGELASSAGAEVVGEVTQNISKYSNTYVGRGKIEEIKQL